MHMAKWTAVDFPLDLKLTVTFRKHHPKEIQISIKITNPVTVPVLALNFRCWSTPLLLG